MPEETKDDLKRLIERLDSDAAVAWEIYLFLWQKLVMYFQQHRCEPAIDYADEALSRVARHTDLDAIHNIGGFAWGVARKMILEIPEKQRRKIGLDDVNEGVISDKNQEARILDGIDQTRKVECVLRCLEELPAHERETFLSFALADPDTRVADRKKLAATMSMSTGTLRVSIFRIKKKLINRVRKCLKTRIHSE